MKHNKIKSASGLLISFRWEKKNLRRAEGGASVHQGVSRGDLGPELRHLQIYSSYHLLLDVISPSLHISTDWL